jgi:phosphotriesterase-related protein
VGKSWPDRAQGDGIVAQVETVRGPVDVSRLGPTLMHEHVFILETEMNHNYPEHSWDGEREARIRRAVETLRRVAAGGIDTIVDLTVLGLGRSIPNIQAVNAEVDINIVVATGIYTFKPLPLSIYNRPARRDGGSGRVEDVMVDLFVRDITEGIGDTGVKAAILKCCTDQPGVTRSIDRVLRAVAWAHRNTGVPISTHTDARLQRGRDQQRIFAEEGVDLSRVVIGHSGDTTDLAYLRELMDRGSTIGMDRFGLYGTGFPSFDERVATVSRLCELGYADRMVLSHDTMCHTDSFPAMLEQNPDWAFHHISEAVLPALRRHGVDDAQIETMLVANPQRLLERRDPY